MKNSITFLMLEHHKKINVDLLALMDGFGMSNKEIDKLYEKFKSSIESHLRLEEQVIFSFDNLGSQEAQHMVRELLAEHGQIRDFLLNFNFPKDFRDQLLDFQKVLFEHERKENDCLYPMLDRNLKEHDKELLLQKIKDMG